MIRLKMKHLRTETVVKTKTKRISPFVETIVAEEKFVFHPQTPSVKKKLTKARKGGPAG